MGRWIFSFLLLSSAASAEVPFQCRAEKGPSDFVEGIYFDQQPDILRLKVSATFFIIEYSRYGPFVDLTQNSVSSRHRLNFSKHYGDYKTLIYFSTSNTAFKRQGRRFRAVLVTDKEYVLNCVYVNEVKFQ